MPAVTRTMVEIYPAPAFKVIPAADFAEAVADEEAAVELASVAAWLLSTEVPVSFS
jgi:hypothetical protein